MSRAPRAASAPRSRRRWRRAGTVGDCQLLPLRIPATFVGRYRREGQIPGGEMSTYLLAPVSGLRFLSVTVNG